MTRLMLKAFAPAAAIGVLLLGGLTGCSSGSAADGKASSAAGGEQAQALKFAKCMREHGVDMPDPGSNLTGTGTGAGDQASPGSVGTLGAGGTIDVGGGDEAYQSCRQFLPNGGQPQKLSAEETAQQVRFAKCMREHGVDFPDPAADGQAQGAPIDMSDKDAMKKLEEASRVCEVAK
ncbi:hypothetical protein [Kitasatospora sp. NPDC057223]|uniref:hypothetical protein n=1 Tax=Kitasatospora sp. NPDC057223 TaxID=3346055 RepID=UPI003642CB26